MYGNIETLLFLNYKKCFSSCKWMVLSLFDPLTKHFLHIWFCGLIFKDMSMSKQQTYISVWMKIFPMCNEIFDNFLCWNENTLDMSNKCKRFPYLETICFVIWHCFWRILKKIHFVIDSFSLHYLISWKFLYVP